MKCEEVRGKLPEYLARVLDENTDVQLRDHLKTCEECGREMKELNNGVALEPGESGNADVEKIMKKTKRKFNLAIFRIVAIIAGVALLISVIPRLISLPEPPNASRALMDSVQFSQPDKVNMWGDSMEFGLSIPLKIGARPVVGRNFGEQMEFTGRMSLLTGKVTVPVFVGASFVHPGQFAGADFGRQRSPEVQAAILSKNADTTVATVDYSLKQLTGLEEVEILLGKYDVEICWMAVEAGIEGVKPENMSFESQQVLQWGIPGKLSKPGKFDYAVFEKGTGKEYEKAVLEELKWLDENKNLLRADPELLKNNGIDNSVNGKAAYILENGIKIYGLRVTGPSSAILKLTQELDVRIMKVVDMDFWNW